MLGAVMFGHRHFQPVVNPDHRVGGKKRERAPRRQVVDGARWKRKSRADRNRLRSGLRHPGQAGSLRCGRQGQGKGDGNYFPEGQERKYDKLRIGGVLQGSGSQRSSAGNILEPASASTAADSKTVRNIIAGSRRAAPRHGLALFTRGETQAWW